MADLFWWVIFPYLTLAVMGIGLLYKFAYRQREWAAPSTEIMEKRWLRIGSPLFHWGIVLAFLGHVMGILVPKGVYEALGVSDETYHAFAVIGGGLVGLMLIAGLVILLIRRLTVGRIRKQSTFRDYFAVGIVLFASVIGTYITIVYNTTVMAYEYKTTIGPWFRSLFYFQPKYQLMADVPFLFQLHVISGFLLFASIPFTSLIHLFSFPIRYPRRAPIQYRSRVGYRNPKGD
jgi:nitrate reductase gamma subunit